MENTNNNIIQTDMAIMKASVVLEIPEHDIELLYRLFDLYCDDQGEEFHPDTWISNTIFSAIRELKQGIREKLKNNPYIKVNKGK